MLEVRITAAPELVQAINNLAAALAGSSGDCTAYGRSGCAGDDCPAYRRTCPGCAGNCPECIPF